jgi:hypothetical protein
VRAVVEKADWKLLELPLPEKIRNQKQYNIPGGIVEISATIKDLKDPRSALLFGLSEKQVDLGE